MGVGIEVADSEILEHSGRHSYTVTFETGFSPNTLLQKGQPHFLANPCTSFAVLGKTRSRVIFRCTFRTMGDAVSSLAHHQSPHIQHRTPILSRFPHPRLVNTLVMVATVYVAPKVVRSVSPVVADGVKYKSASE